MVAARRLARSAARAATARARARGRPPRALAGRRRRRGVPHAGLPAGRPFVSAARNGRDALVAVARRSARHRGRRHRPYRSRSRRPGSRRPLGARRRRAGASGHAGAARSRSRLGADAPARRRPTARHGRADDDRRGHRRDRPGQRRVDAGGERDDRRPARARTRTPGSSTIPRRCVRCAPRWKAGRCRADRSRPRSRARSCPRGSARVEDGVGTAGELAGHVVDGAAVTRRAVAAGLALVLLTAPRCADRGRAAIGPRAAVTACRRPGCRSSGRAALGGEPGGIAARRRRRGRRGGRAGRRRARRTRPEALVGPGRRCCARVAVGWRGPRGRADTPQTAGREDASPSTARAASGRGRTASGGPTASPSAVPGVSTSARSPTACSRVSASSSGTVRWRVVLAPSAPRRAVSVSERTALAVDAETGTVAVTVRVGRRWMLAVRDLWSGADRGLVDLGTGGPASAPVPVAPGLLAVGAFEPGELCMVELRDRVGVPQCVAGRGAERIRPRRGPRRRGRRGRPDRSRRIGHRGRRRVPEGAVGGAGAGADPRQPSGRVRRRSWCSPTGRACRGRCAWTDGADLGLPPEDGFVIGEAPAPDGAFDRGDQGRLGRPDRAVAAAAPGASGGRFAPRLGREPTGGLLRPTATLPPETRIQTPT